MYRNKRDVDKHVLDQLNKAKNDTEKFQRGHNFAKLYYQVKDFESAKRYLTGFISIKPNHSIAHRLMGQIHVATNNLEFALESYKRSLELDQKQDSLILKICEIYTQIPVDHETARYWADKGDSVFPHNDTIFKLRECIVNTEGGSNSKEIEDLIQNELAYRPGDVDLVTKLIKFYLDKERIDEAYSLAIKEDNKGNHFQNVNWHYCLMEVFEIYQEENKNKLNQEFYMHFLVILCRLVVLTLAEAHALKEKKTSSISAASSALYMFDQQLSKAHAFKQPTSGDGWSYVLQQMKGQLYFFMAALIIKKSQKEQGNKKEAMRFAAPLFLIAHSYKPVNLLLESWFSRVKELQKIYLYVFDQAGIKAIQSAHIITLLCKEDQRVWLKKIKNELCVSSIRERIYHRAFDNTSNKQLSTTSQFLSDPAFMERSLEFPQLDSLQDSYKVVQQIYSDSLHHLVWLALSGQSRGKMQLPFTFQLFENLPLNTSLKNKNTSGPETLCKMDMESFLQATIYLSLTYLNARKEKMGVVVGEALLSVPVDISKPMCTVEQAEWWHVASMLINNQAKEHLADYRRTLQHGLGVIRGIGNHGLDVRLTIHLAHYFSEKATDLKGENEDLNTIEVAALDERAGHYWQISLNILDKLYQNQTLRTNPSPLFESIAQPLSSDEVISYKEEGELFLACLTMNQGELETASHMFEKLSAPHASFCLALCLKQLAEEDNKNSIRGMSPGDKQTLLLTRARNALFTTLDRIKGESNHPLNLELHREIEEVETRLAGIHGAHSDCDEESPNISRNGSIDHVASFLKSPPYYTPPTNKPLRPSLERLDAQIRLLMHSQEKIENTINSMSTNIVEKVEELTRTFNSMKQQLDDLVREKQVTKKKEKKVTQRIPYNYEEEDNYEDYQDEDELPTNVAHRPRGPQPPIWDYLSNLASPYDPRSPLPPQMNYSLMYPPHYPPLQYPPAARMHPNLSLYAQQPVQPPPLSSTIQFKPNISSFTLPIPEENPSSLISTPYAHLSQPWLSSTPAKGPPAHPFQIEMPPITSPVKTERSRVDSVVSDVSDVSHDALPDFKPIIPLPEEVAVTTGEENETVLFKEQAKLYRFVDKEWKERGAGLIKVLKNEISSKVRIIMRRDQVLKVCANHYLTPEMTFTPLNNNEKTWVWAGQDFADGAVVNEKFCVRFKTAEMATTFKQVIDSSKNLLLNQSKEKPIFDNKKAPQSFDTSPAITSGFGDQFKPPAGSWACKICYVTNSADKTKCIACETLKPGITAVSPAVTSSFGDKFKPPAGSWACKICYVTNSADKTKCIACETLKPGITAASSPNSESSMLKTQPSIFSQLAVSKGGSFNFSNKFDSSLDTNNTPQDQKSIFGTINVPKTTPEGANMFPTSTTDSPLPATTSTQSSGGFQFTTSTSPQSQTSFFSQLANKMKDSSTTASSFGTISTPNQTTKSVFSRLGSSDSCKTDSASSFGMISSSASNQSVNVTRQLESVNICSPNLTTTTTSNTSIFGMPDGITPVKPKTSIFAPNPTVESPGSPFTSSIFGMPQKKGDALPTQSIFGSNPSNNTTTPKTPVFGQQKACNFNDNIFEKSSTNQQPADLSTKSEVKASPFSNFSFTGATQNKDSSSKESKPSPFVNFSFTGNQSTPILNKKSSTFPEAKVSPRVTKEETDEFEPTAEFKPVIDLPDIVDLKTGEEDEEKMFGERAKLYRFDSETKQWKEKGQGEIKILKNKLTGKARILMRRDQVLKICANHLITSDIVLQKFNTDTTWMYNACNYEDGEVKPEMLAVKFKTSVIATEFKQTLEKCQVESKVSDLKPQSTTISSNDKPPIKDLFKPKPGSWECSSCYVTNEASQSTCLACCSPNPSKPQQFALGGQQNPFVFGGNTTPAFGNSSFQSNSLFGSSNPKTPEKNIKTPTGSPAGFKFGSPQKYEFTFDIINPGSPVKTPKSAGILSDGGEDEVEPSEADNIYFQPVVPLPPKVEVKTGEEGEDIVYSHRAKLFRFIDGEWKERGVGDVKILKCPITKKFRLLMRREKVLKVCLNHYLTSDIVFSPKGDKAWTWMASDFSEGATNIENFCIRFKDSDYAKDFKDAIDNTFPKLATSSVTPIKSLVKTSVFETSPSETKDLDTQVYNDVKITFEKKPTQDQIDRAQALLLPDTFFLYEGAPKCKGCRGCNDLIPEIGERSSSDSSVEIIPPAKPVPEDSTNKIPLEDNSIFTGTKISFADLAGTSEKSFLDKTYEGTFNFPGAGSMIFVGPKKEATKETSNQENEDNVEPAGDIHFEPIIPLPDLVEVTTGEENEDVAYCHRAKLYRFDQETQQWKERGVGDFKILKNKSFNKYRLVLRRDQVHKVVCNHYLTENLNFAPLATSDVSLCWSAIDFSETSEGQAEKFAIKFKNVEIKDTFKENIAQFQKEIISTSVSKPSELQEHPSNVSNSFKPQTYENDSSFSGVFVKANPSLSGSSFSAFPNTEEEEEDDDDEYDDDDPEKIVMFEDFVHFSVLDQSSNIIMEDPGSYIQMTYDDTVFGARIQVFGGEDEETTLTDHHIAIQTSLFKNNNIGTWTAVDYTLDPPQRRTVSCRFASNQVLEDFSKAFDEGKEFAVQAEIVEHENSLPFHITSDNINKERS